MIPSGTLVSLEMRTRPMVWECGREGRVRPWIVWIIALTWSLAVASPLAIPPDAAASDFPPDTAASAFPPDTAASVFPPDADVFLTSERGTIVGVGRITEGRTFEIRILQGFSGPARLTLVAPGEVSVVDIVVRGRDPQTPDGDLLLSDGASVFASLRLGGVVIAVVWSEAPAAGFRAPGILGSNASEQGLENANPRASEGGNPRSGEDDRGRRP